MIEQTTPSFHDEGYADLIVYYYINPNVLLGYKDAIVHKLNDKYAIVHVPISQISMKTINTFGYVATPRLYGLTSRESLTASGVYKLRNMPRFNLTGKGVLIGIVDTGIEYNNPVFIRPNGTTKIVSIWDQTHEDTMPSNRIPFGTEYTLNQINQALKEQNPLTIVPSTDENGHGTMMAGVAAGNNTENGFSGVVPDSQLVIVKMKQAKSYLKNFYMVPNDVICYQENHIMWGIQYCTNIAKELNKPLVICLGIGTSQGAHSGYSPLGNYLSIFSDFPKTAITTSVGNEGNRKRHFSAMIDPTIGYVTVELIVGEKDKGFTMELWGDAPGLFYIDILSPNGEYITPIPVALWVNREIAFIYDETVIYIDYQIHDLPIAGQIILMRFKNVFPGTWTFKVYSKGDLKNRFDIWLPMGDMISEDTFFTQPDIYTTVLGPGTAPVPISITAYDSTNNTLYHGAGRGFTKTNSVKPELAAPGVNYLVPKVQGGYTTYTGTGVATAHAAGIVAMLFEWGIINGNAPDLNSIEIKKYLIRGALRNPNLDYPNRDWGYGIIDIYNVFNILRS